MAKGRRHATGAGPPGEGAIGIPSETLTTAQPARPDPAAGDGSASGRLSGAEPHQAVKDALAIVPMVITRIELWKTDSLVPLERHPRTPRTHSDEQIAQIAASMREFGFLGPIMVNGGTRVIVAANGRYLAAMKLGLPLVPVVEERHLNPVQRRAFIIADNKIALNAGWSNERLYLLVPTAVTKGTAASP